MEETSPLDGPSTSSDNSSSNKHLKMASNFCLTLSLGARLGSFLVPERLSFLRQFVQLFLQLFNFRGKSLDMQLIICC